MKFISSIGIGADAATKLGESISKLLNLSSLNLDLA
jgi:hypothetical protein